MREYEPNWDTERKQVRLTEYEWELLKEVTGCHGNNFAGKAIRILLKDEINKRTNQAVKIAIDKGYEVKFERDNFGYLNAIATKDNISKTIVETRKGATFSVTNL